MPLVLVATHHIQSVSVRNLQYCRIQGFILRRLDMNSALKSGEAGMSQNQVLVSHLPLRRLVMLTISSTGAAVLRQAPSVCARG